MYSFYGGKEGRTYHIVKRFPSVSAMETAFSLGDQYTLVMYHLYVLIDTTAPALTIDNETFEPIGINSPDNGKLYRRGFDGPILVGNIRGASGNTANIVFTEINSTEAATTTYAKTHSASTSDNTANAVKIKYKIEESVDETPPDFKIEVDTPYPNFIAAAASVSHTASPTASISQISGKPYNYNVTYGIPAGIPGTKLLNASISNTNKSNQRFVLTGTTYDANSSGNAVFDVPYRTVTTFSLNSTNNILVANFAGSGTGTNSSQTVGQLSYTATVQGTYTENNLPTTNMGLIVVEKDNKKYIYAWDNGQNKYIEAQNLSDTVEPKRVITVTSNSTDSLLYAPGGIILHTSSISIMNFGE